MKTIFKTLALGLLLLAVASCEKHDLFDENTITGAVGPEAYWTIESSMMKAGESMGFTGQYYSTVAEIDHSEVWYDLFEKEDKVVTAAAIKSFTYSFSQSTATQKRILQTIQSYEHSQDLWNDSLRAFVVEGRFPVSNTLSPIVWANPKDTNGFSKNLRAYFGENFATEFKDGLTPKMNPTEEERHYGAYMDIINSMGMLGDTIVTPNGEQMPYSKWITDSTFNANTNSWNRYFKQNDTIWSKVNFDTLGYTIDTIRTKVNIGTNRNPIMVDTIIYKTNYILKPWADSVIYVYPEIKHVVDSIWENHVTFYDLIYGAEGYSVDFKREYYINAELRIYDVNGNYSSTDAKQININ